MESPASSWSADVGPLKLDVSMETLPLKAPFRISGYVFESVSVVLVTLSDGQNEGRGEASGVYYLNEDASAMATAIEGARQAIEAGTTRQALRELLSGSGARNAVDCALWELEARQVGKPVWELAGLGAPRPLVTTFTLGADHPEAMAEAARALSSARAIKIKLTGDFDLDVARVAAVRDACPNAWLMVDANQGFGIDELDRLVAAMAEARVSLIEQPLARGREADLDGFRSPIPIAADESALVPADVASLAGRFDVVNIKLDKCGGLTAGLEMAEAARALGLGVMVGNMVGTSLAMAPAFLLGQVCEVVDLDGPTFLMEDRKPSLRYHDGKVYCDDAVWGGA
jgi:L-Ala-D/L-Glu epimerase